MISEPLSYPADDVAVLVRQRRRVRLLRFIICEAVVLALLGSAIAAGLAERFAAPSLTPLFRTLPIALAVVSALLPIVFFGNPKRRRRPRRRLN